MMLIRKEMAPPLGALNSSKTAPSTIKGDKNGQQIFSEPDTYPGEPQA